jgi:predicted methyltransferase
MDLLRKPHLTTAQFAWKQLIHPADRVIDATIGNGYDTYFLAKLLQGQGELIGYDIQPQALVQTQKRLEALPPSWRQNIHLKLQSHAALSETNVKLIVYNLGYLPRGDKKITTQRTSTLQSIGCAMQSLAPGGAISITCYPGHPEGALEQEGLVAFLQTLPSNQWDVYHHVWLYPNRRLTPSWIWIQAVHCA